MDATLARNLRENSLQLNTNTVYVTPVGEEKSFAKLHNLSVTDKLDHMISPMCYVPKEGLLDVRSFSEFFSYTKGFNLRWTIVASSLALPKEVLISRGYEVVSFDAETYVDYLVKFFKIKASKKLIPALLAQINILGYAWVYQFLFRKSFDNSEELQTSPDIFNFFKHLSSSSVDIVLKHYFTLAAEFPVSLVQGSALTFFGRVLDYYRGSLNVQKGGMYYSVIQTFANNHKPKKIYKVIRFLSSNNLGKNLAFPLALRMLDNSRSKKTLYKQL